MLSREKGQSMATRPVADAEAEETGAESGAVGLPASADSEVATRIAVKTKARRIHELRLRVDERCDERRMRVARAFGRRVTVEGCGVTSRCGNRGDCT